MIRTYGQYSTSRDLSVRGFCNVSVTDVGDENFWGAKPQVVKAMQWPEPLVSSHRASDWVEEFVESAELQRALASEGAASWAPVHAVARQEDGGAYYVTDLHDASARLLASARFQWSVYTAAWLRDMVLGVLEGLEELQNRRGRAHGNLRGGNILVDGLLRGEGLTVSLVDPATSGSIVRRSHGEQEDMRDLGLVLHEMILHTPFRELGGWPLEDSEAWRLLGDGLGDAWRELVAWLIDPKAARGSRTIIECRKRVQALPEPKIPTSATKVLRYGLIGAAGLALAVFGGNQLRIALKDFDPEAWDQYVSDYNWVDNLVDQSEDPNSLLMTDERLSGLRTVVLGVNPQRLKASYVLDDDGIDAVPPVWRTEPPEAAQPGAVVNRTQIAVRNIDAIRRAVESEDFALRRELNALAAPGTGQLVDGVGERWEGLAEFIRTVEDDFETVAQQLPLSQAIDVISGAQRVDELGATLAEYEDRFEASRDPVLREFGYFKSVLMERGLESAEGGAAFDDARDVADWVAQLAELAEAAAQADAALAEDLPKVDLAYMLASEEYEQLVQNVQGSRGEPEFFREDLLRWVELARDGRFVMLDASLDPRDPSLGERIASLKTQADELRESPALSSALEERLDTLESALEEPAPLALLAGDDALESGSERATLSEHIARIASLSWVEGLREQVETGAQATSGAVSRFEAELASIQEAEQQIAAEYVDNLEAEERVAESASVNSLWRDRRDDLLSAYSETGVLRDLVDEADAARALLTRIDGALTAPDEVRADAEPQTWDGELLLGLVRAQREQQLAEVVSRVDWSLGDEALSNAVDASLAAQQRTYNAWQARVAELVSDMARAEALMASVHLPEDQPADGGRSVAEIFAFWAGDDVAEAVQAPEVFNAIFSLFNRVDALSRASESELASLAGDAEAPEIVSFGAWRRLGEVEAGGAKVWPDSLADLERERSLREVASEIAESVSDGAQRSRLQAELAEEGQQRWARLAQRVTSDAEIEALLELEEAFGVDRTALDARTRYNTALAELRRLSDDAFVDKDETVEDGIRRFIALAQQSGGRYTAAANRMSSLLATAAATPDTIDFEEYGPALVGWEVTDASRRQTRVTYTSPNGVEVEFALVRRKGANDIISRPFFIMTNEVSVRVARELMNSVIGPRADAAADSIRRDLEENFSIGATVSINWEGPRVWNWSDQDLFRTGLMLNQAAAGDGWLWPNQFADDHSLVSPEILASQSRPSFDHPLNHVSPSAAVTLAERLHPEGSSPENPNLVRIPTAQQWQAAYAFHEAPQEAEGRLWNLRDETWRQQQQHAVGVRRQLNAQASFFQLPDAGIFLPEGRSDIPTGESATIIDRGTADGTLWFDYVDSREGEGLNGSTYEAPGAVLKHMIGNVAELVRVEEGSGFAVIGGSAMSPPELDPLEPQVIARGFNQLERSYSDVGFRLSFETDDFREPLSVMLSDALVNISGDY